MLDDNVLRELVTKKLNEFGGGARRFEQSVGLKPGALRGILHPSRRQSPSLQRTKEICEALGWEFYAGPQRSSSRNILFSSTNFVPNNGLAKCGLTGWFENRDDGELPAPENISDKAAFYVRAIGHSMVPEGIRSGAFCLVSPNQQTAIDDRIYIEDESGKASIKRLVDEDVESYYLRGWQSPIKGKQTSYDEQRFKKGLRRVAPVIAVFNARPVAGEKPVSIPDPRIEDLSSNQPRSAGWLIQENTGTIQLAGYAGANNKIAFDGGFNPDELAPAPPDGEEGLAVVEVRGDSANPYLRSGDLVYFHTHQTDGFEKYIGRFVLATTSDGMVYMKILWRGRQDGLWNLQNINPAHGTMEDVKLSRISPFAWIHFKDRLNPFQKV